MRQAASVDDVLTGIEQAAREGMDAGLRASGAVLAPAVHMLAEDLDQPYVGYLSCRPFYRGADAAAAVAELGELPSVLATTRLVVTWEAQDLTIALRAPADPDTALLVLDATPTGHAIRWCPLRLHAGTGRYGDVVVPEWGPPVSCGTRRCRARSRRCSRCGGSGATGTRTRPSAGSKRPGIACAGRRAE